MTKATSSARAKDVPTVPRAIKYLTSPRRPSYSVRPSTKSR